jgi:hypothetical protein
MTVCATISISLLQTKTSYASDMVEFATGGYARGVQTETMMHKIDKDGDGTVSHEEFIADQTALFDLMDTGHSGAVGPREFLDRKFPDAR